MAKREITFKLLAYSDAAGKYNHNAPLNGNEDNFYVDDDISDDIPGRCQMDKILHLSDCGCLMVVADGMGGMNAGEVASDIAISTVKELFSPGMVSSKIAESSEERRKYLENVIKEADKRIKYDAKVNPEHDGMGSTIIMAWIVGDKITISWCGDSRAYRFNPINGIEPLSRDHSYVQELVNRGDLKYEDTFEHPQGNIVTRSLGDPDNAARPETREFNIYKDDIILLCSDGLSGVLRDKKTKDHNGNYYPGENIEDIIYSNCSSLSECKNALMDAAERADWYDNVTVLLCQIIDGAPNAIKRMSSNDIGYSRDQSRLGNKGILLKHTIIIGIVCFLLGLCLGLYLYYEKKGSKENIVENQEGEQTSEVYDSDVPTSGTGSENALDGDQATTKTAVVEEERHRETQSLDKWKNDRLALINKLNCPQDVAWLKKKVTDAISRVRIDQRFQKKDKAWVDSLINDLQKRINLIARLNQIGNKLLCPEQQEEWESIMRNLISNLSKKPDYTSIDKKIKLLEAHITSLGGEQGLTQTELTSVGSQTDNL